MRWREGRREGGMERGERGRGAHSNAGCKCFTAVCPLPHAGY